MKRKAYALISLAVIASMTILSPNTTLADSILTLNSVTVSENSNLNIASNDGFLQADSISTHSLNANSSVTTYGDINSDGNIDAIDYAVLKKVLLGSDLQGINLSAADVNLDGQVDAIDFAVLKSYLMKIIDSLPIGKPGNAEFTNTSFEEGSINGWTLGPQNTSGATYASSRSSRTGRYQLSCYAESNYVSDIYQDVTGLQPGYYYITCYVQNGGNQNSAYLYANGTGQNKCMTAIPVTNALNTENSQEYGWTLVTVRGIQVSSNGNIRIGFYSDANAKNWVNLDDFTIYRESNQSQQKKFYVGGDISELCYVEDMGAKFYDSNGKEQDAVELLADNGWNIARLRLYNNPGKGRGDGTYYCKDNYQNINDILNLAKRAKKAGLAVQLTLHYSDFWTNGLTQNIPADWKSQISGLSTADAVTKLEKLVYTYTKSVMEQMLAQGITPESVSLGNEMQAGILYPYGSTSNFANLARLLNAGYSAVKEASSSTKVILHLDDAGNADKYIWFFDSCKTYNVKYDIIGASYYPYYTKLTANKVADFCNKICARYDKDIIIMETGFNFYKYLPNGYEGQLKNNGTYEGYYESSPKGQKDFMLELINALKNVKDGRCIGDIYWDPVMVEQNGVGWAIVEATNKADTNVVSNTTLFDFNHVILPVINAYKYNN